MKNIYFVQFVMVVGFLSFASSPCLAETKKTAKQEESTTGKLMDHFDPTTSKAKEGAELQTVEVPRGSASKLRVRLVQKPVCSFGDLDAVNLELMYSKKARLLLSLECVSCGTKGESREITAMDLVKRESDMDIAIPKVSEPQLFGLSICKDSEGTGTCKNKNLLSISQILTRYAPDNAERLSLDPASPSDKVFFFSQMIVYPEKIVAITSPFGQKQRIQLEELVKRDNVANASQSVQETARFNDTLGSLPVRAARGNVLALDLPYYDVQRCNEAAKNAKYASN